jgi:hypothetical protein
VQLACLHLEEDLERVLALARQCRFSILALVLVPFWHLEIVVVESLEYYARTGPDCGHCSGYRVVERLIAKAVVGGMGTGRSPDGCAGDARGS